MFLIIVKTIINFLALVLPLLIAVAFLTLAERKVLAAIQKRKGPNVVGFLGILQPFADGVKLLTKELVMPASADVYLFSLAPILTFFLSLSAWAVVPFGELSVVADIDLGLLYIFAVSSLGVYGILGAGWGSNSRYAFLGALRSAAQMVSYEVSIGLILINILLFTSSLNLIDIVLFQESIWFIVPLFPLFIMYVVSALAETNRPPFDLPEAESELVAGYNVEYASVGFVLFFIGEYANIILQATLCVIFFFGGWLAPFGIMPFPAFWFTLKLFFFLFFWVWVRAAFPRYRYDQLMDLGWKVFLPYSLAWVCFTALVLFSLDWLV